MSVGTYSEDPKFRWVPGMTRMQPFSWLLAFSSASQTVTMRS